MLHSVFIILLIGRLFMLHCLFVILLIYVCLLFGMYPFDFPFKILYFISASLIVSSLTFCLLRVSIFLFRARLSPVFESEMYPFCSFLMLFLQLHSPCVVLCNSPCTYQFGAPFPCINFFILIISSKIYWHNFCLCE